MVGTNYEGISYYEFKVLFKSKELYASSVRLNKGFILSAEFCYFGNEKYVHDCWHVDTSMKSPPVAIYPLDALSSDL